MGRFSLNHDEDEEDEDGLERHCCSLQEAPVHENSLALQEQNHVNEEERALNGYYYTYDPPPSPRARLSMWWWLTIAIATAHIVARYGPPAPPTKDLNWEEFLWLESSRLVSAFISLASVIPHVWHWCVQGMRLEVAQKYKEFTKKPPCSMMIPEVLDFEIVGQDRAESIVSDALHAWQEGAQPLFLLLTGTVGVGKLELANQVARHLFGHCPSENMPVLIVDGNDNENHLTTVVLRYVRCQAGQGAVVILRHVEGLAPNHLLDLLVALQHEQRIILVATTHVGTRTIHQYLKQYRNLRDTPRLELDLAMREALDDYFQMDISKYFHSIAPFTPLTQSDLQQILLQQVKRWNNEQDAVWQMTDRLASALVDPSRVEYIEWKDKTSGEVILVFAGTGAKAIAPGSFVYNKLKSQIKKCLPMHGVGKLDYDAATNEGTISWCDAGTCHGKCRFSLD